MFAEFVQKCADTVHREGFPLKNHYLQVAAYFWCIDMITCMYACRHIDGRTDGLTDRRTDRQTNIHTYTHIHTHIYTYTHTHIHTCTHIHMHAHTHTYTDTCTHTQIHTRMQACMTYARAQIHTSTYYVYILPVCTVWYVSFWFSHLWMPNHNFIGKNPGIGRNYMQNIMCSAVLRLVVEYRGTGWISQAHPERMVLFWTPFPNALGAKLPCFSGLGLAACSSS